MNIAVFIKRTTLHENYGGLETQNQNLCEELVKRGHKVYVFSPQLEYTGNKMEMKNGVNYVFVKSSYRSLAGFGHLDKNNWINRSVEDFNFIHKQENFDVILGQSSAALGLVREKKKIGVPIISISHGTTIGEYKTRLQSLSGFKDYLKLIPDTLYVLLNFFKRQREFVLHSNRVIAVSSAVKNALIEETYVPEDRVKVIYNGIDPNEIKYIPPTKQDLAKENKLVKFVYLGLVHKSKGLDDLIKAVKGIQNSKLTVIGDGPYLQEIKQFIKQNNLENRITVTGRMEHHEALAKLTNFDIFVLPSKRMEGFPMTLVEAMFAGLPIIGADIGGVPEAIEDGKTGFIVESGNIDQLKSKMTYLIENAPERQQMRKNARNKALQEFTIQKMVDSYLQVINEVTK